MGVRKFCDLEFVELENDNGMKIPGVRAICADCGAETESFGQGATSIRRCMAHMHDACECPDGEYAFFTCDELELHDG